jgi:hypothetical protein
VGYREFATPTTLSDLVECAWVTHGPSAPIRVLPLLHRVTALLAAGADVDRVAAEVG